LVIVFIIIAGPGCPKKSKEKRVAGSSAEGFIINAPSNLSATAVSFYQIDLSWQDNSNNEDGFEIERSTDGVNYVLLSTLNVNTTSYSDAGLTPAFTYYYRVRAYNTIGDYSGYSNDINAITFNRIWMPVTWARVDAGWAHNIGLTPDGTVWSWGANDVVQLGIGDTRDRNLPVPVGTDSDWLVLTDNSRSVFSAGDYHNLVIKTNGTLWGWGMNGAGQLGFGTTEYDGIIPYQIGSDSDWFTLAAGTGHSVAIKTNRTIWSWGGNWYGQLGLGDVDSRFAPVQIGTGSDWSIISARSNHTITIKTNRTIWSWGANQNGQLGLGNINNRYTPAQIGTNSDWMMVTTNRGLNYGSNSNLGHVLAMKTDQTLWTWGRNDFGQLGIGNSSNRTTPTSVSTEKDWSIIGAGTYHSFAIKTNNTLWACGINTGYQLGLGDITNRNRFTQVVTSFDWSMVASSEFHSIGLKTDGSRWAWGINNRGQLGLGDTFQRPIPVKVDSPSPPSSLLANVISSSQIALAWIDNAYNESGFKIERKIGRSGSYVQIAIVSADITSYSDITTPSFAPVTTYYYRVRSYNTVGDSSYSNEGWTAISGDWTDVVIGSIHIIGRKSNGTLWAWGSNLGGALGLVDGINRYTPTQIETDSDWAVAVAGGSSGMDYNIAFKTNGTIWGWGYNNYGQLGIGDQFNKYIPTQVGTNTNWANISAGGYHTIACKTNNTLWGWGWNYSGQLGLNDITNRTSPTQIGTESDWSVIATGSNCTIARKTNRTIWGWGANGMGQLGLGDNNQRNTPSQIGSVSDWSMISVRYIHALAIKTNYTLWGWGNNTYGQLGLGDLTSRNTPTQISNNTDWVSISAGEEYSVGQKINGTIWSWGCNNYGQLGLGNSGIGTERNTPTQIGIATDWTIVLASSASTVARKNNGTLWVWGAQFSLGDDSNNKTIPTIIPVGD
jgi:alpha-tubulin suppressor-like RCC1 family protein